MVWPLSQFCSVFLLHPHWTDSFIRIHCSFCVSVSVSLLFFFPAAATLDWLQSLSLSLCIASTAWKSLSFFQVHGLTYYYLSLKCQLFSLSVKPFLCSSASPWLHQMSSKQFCFVFLLSQTVSSYAQHRA